MPKKACQHWSMTRFKTMPEPSCNAFSTSTRSGLGRIGTCKTAVEIPERQCYCCAPWSYHPHSGRAVHQIAPTWRIMSVFLSGLDVVLRSLNLDSTHPQRQSGGAAPAAPGWRRRRSPAAPAQQLPAAARALRRPAHPAAREDGQIRHSGRGHGTIVRDVELDQMLDVS